MTDTLLETKNFTISSDGRKIIDDIGVINGQRVSIKVKINPEGDVWEYVSGMPSEFVGQQVFTFNAALREVQKAGKSLPADQNALMDAIAMMPGETELQKYKNYFTATNIKLTGCYSSGLHVFDDIGIRAYYWLDDGTRLNLNATTRGVARRDETMGYTVKCF